MSYRSPLLTLLLAAVSICLVIMLVTHPETSFQAAIAGLKAWWDVVFPATLPFIVIAEIMMGFGVVHFVGVLLEPLMRPLFNVPGTGGFVLTMGFASGYPVTAKLTTRLRENGSLTQAEGERLVSFATTGDPLFVLGAVAIGFFHSEQLGFVLAASHYLSALFIGILYRFHAPGLPSSKGLLKDKRPLVYRALQAMHRARVRDGRPFGKLMGEAVQSAIQTLLMIGGFLIFFSVLIELLKVVHITQLLATMLSVIFGPFGFPHAFSDALIAGLLEVTLGAQGASQVPGDTPLILKTALAAAIVSWGGLSVHAQVASILSPTDIRVAPYLLARFLHAIIAVILTFVLWNPLSQFASSFIETAPVFSAEGSTNSFAHWWYVFSHAGVIALGLLGVLLLLSYTVSKNWGKSYR